MTEKSQIYKCAVCGNIVEVLHSGVGELVCCGQPTGLLEEKAKEQEGREKHVPVVVKTEKGVVIKIGEMPHPMDTNHFIEWIEVNTEKGSYRKYLSPGTNPSADFEISEEVKSVRAYCNVHGLWKS